VEFIEFVGFIGFVEFGRDVERARSTRSTISTHYGLREPQELRGLSQNSMSLAAPVETQ
jgi:hypothetical protein